MKKGKLILSLSLMCLSITVLCFGVFAAASVSYSISGTISYTVTDAFVTVSTKVYRGTNQYATDDALSTLATALAGKTQTLSGANFTEDNTYSISDYNSTSGQNFAQTIDLTLSSTNKSYLVEMTITNLSPSVNVWAMANWELKTGSNITQGNNEAQTEIDSSNSKKIYFIVSIKDLTESVSSAEYKMGLNIGIGVLEGTTNVNGEAIEYNYGSTWAEFVANSTDSVYTLDTVDGESCVLRDNSVLKLDGVNVKSTDVIKLNKSYIEDGYIEVFFGVIKKLGDLDGWTSIVEYKVEQSIFTKAKTMNELAEERSDLLTITEDSGDNDICYYKGNRIYFVKSLDENLVIEKASWSTGCEEFADGYVMYGYWSNE